MSNPYWLHPLATTPDTTGRKMGVVTLPPVREHMNPSMSSHFMIRPVQQHAVEPFQVGQPTRTSHHTR